jgi:hypothetical protein
MMLMKVQLRTLWAFSSVSSIYKLYCNYDNEENDNNDVDIDDKYY